MSLKKTLKRHTQFTDRTIWVNGLPPIERRPDFWGRALSELMDVLVFGAIYLTNEVQLWPFLVSAFLIATRTLTQVRLKAVWMVTGFLLQIFLGLLLIFRIPLHPLVAAAHVAPLAIAWLGVARGGVDLWGSRMALGFIGLILASALTPDFSVMLLILAFVVFGSIGLACRFLSAEFTRRGVTGSLPPGFIRRSFYQSGILLLSALIIFPLIPRVSGRGGGGFGNDPSKTGYTEEVNLGEWIRVSNQGSTATALRVYGPNGADPTPYIPSGLLRSRVLNVLASNHWNAAPIKMKTTREFTVGNQHPTLMIVREMIGTPNLPIPYGTSEVSIELDGYRWNAEKTMVEEWREARSRNLRFKYYASIDPQNPKAPQDTPTAIELAVPEAFKSVRMKNLVEKLFKNARTPEAKITAIQTHFQREKFTATYAEDARPRSGTEDEKVPPIERFLFLEKSGHCELFSSATAILLRMGGVPTRLIAGFRVTRNSYGDVLTVRQSDAHAWVEAYRPKHGWTVIDPTPRTLQMSGVTDWLRDTYDWASAKWTQYILNYGEGENSLQAQLLQLKRIARQLSKGENPLQAGSTDTNVYLFTVIFIIGALFFSFLAIAIFRKLRESGRGTPLARTKLALQKERLRMDALRVTLESNRSQPALDLEITNWFKLYELARFRDVEMIDRAAIAEIRRRRVAIESQSRRAG